MYIKAHGDTIFWAASLLWAVAAGGFGLYGWWLYETEVVGRQVELAMLLTVLGRTVGFFFANSPSVQPPADSIWLLSAYLMAPLVAVAALVRLGLRFFSRSLRARRIRRSRGHTVVCGSSSQAMAFARSERRRGNRVVLVAADLLEADQTLAVVHGFDLVRGDPLDTEVLRAAAVPRAARLLVALDEDRQNLEVVMQASALVSTRPSTLGPLLANVSIQRRHLWRQLVRSDAISRSRARLEILPFNLSASAARHFTWDQHLWRYAWLRDQTCIHAVFLGYDDYTEALIGQLPPACTHVELDRPRFSILTIEPAKTEKRLQQAYPALAEIADVELVRFDAEIDALDEALMAEVAECGAVTAVFVCRDDNEASLATALDVREAMRRNGVWRAPVYVHLNQCEGIGQLLIDARSARRFGEVIQAFGIEDRLCDLALLEGTLEVIAQRFHAGYQGARAAVDGEAAEDPNQDSLSDWRHLDESLRDANRRAADHIPSKLGSVDCVVPPGSRLVAPVAFGLYRDDCELEKLAELEHDSWLTGRHVDGWRYAAVRDKARKHHPALVSYSELDDTTRDFDRAQIRLLDRDIIERTQKQQRSHDIIRREHRIGLIAAEAATPETMQRICAALEQRHLPEILERAPDAQFTLFTSLFPGPELVAARRILEFFCERGALINLVVVEHVDMKPVWAQLRSRLTEGLCWIDTEGVSVSEASEQAGALDRIARERQALIGSDSCEWVIELDTDGRETKADAGRELLLSYLARKTHSLLQVSADWEVKCADPRPHGAAAATGT